MKENETVILIARHNERELAFVLTDFLLSNPPVLLEMIEKLRVRVLTAQQ